MPPQTRLAVAGIFQSVPYRLQKETLLRIRHFRLSRRNIEKQGVKFVHIVNKPTPFRVNFSLLFFIRVVKLMIIPSVRGYL